MPSFLINAEQIDQRQIHVDVSKSKAISYRKYACCPRRGQFRCAFPRFGELAERVTGVAGLSAGVVYYVHNQGF